jgi:flagellar biosynthesis/type III secretory pathway M-ring protein FliF/YscJ
MFEDAIRELDSMGIPYAENEDGTLVIDISSADKTDVVTIVSFLNDQGMEYTIDADSISLAAPMEAPVEPTAEPDTTATGAAMTDAMGGMDGMY